jgi:translation initiation factor 3 subunit J
MSQQETVPESWDDAETTAEVLPSGASVEVKFDAEPEKATVKDSWDEDDAEPAKPPTSSPAAPAAPPSTKPAKARKQALKEKEEKEQQAAAAAAASAVAIDPLKEKQRRQRVVEETDLKHAQEMYGDLSSAGELDSFVPKSTEDFVQFARMLGERATHFGSDVHYLDFAKELCRVVAEPLKADDVRQVIATLNVTMNAKMKLEKGPQSTASKKKQIAQQQKAKMIAAKAGDDDPEFEDDGADDYHAIEDKYDFM